MIGQFVQKYIAQYRDREQLPPPPLNADESPLYVCYVNTSKRILVQFRIRTPPSMDRLPQTPPSKDHISPSLKC